MSRLAGCTAVALGLCLLAQSGFAQDRVYRCGADGRGYSDEPCAGGRSVEVDDARSPQQVAQARQVALRDGRLADALAQNRQRSERESMQRAAAGIGPAPVPTDTCLAGKRCTVREASKRHRDKPLKVTLYRAPADPH
jgi:hypothetical protein